MLAKISSRSNSSSDVWRDGDDAVSPPALLCCAAVKESSNACAGDGVARAGDGGGVPSLERRRGEPSVEDGVTDRARLMAACWRGSAALNDWVESSMARRAQSVRVGAGNDWIQGVSAARAFLPSLSEPRDACASGAGHGRPRQFVCRPALAPGNRLWRSPTASLAATTSSEGPAVFSARVQTPGKALGRAAGRDLGRSSPASLPTKMAEKRTCTHPGARRRVFGPLSSGFKHRAKPQVVFPLCGFRRGIKESASI